MGEKFSANPVTGTGSLSIPIATSPGRGGFGPHLALTYDSGAGNGLLGIGWSLGLGAISRKTDKGLPTYQDAGDSDTFLLAGAEDLVPCTVPMLGLAPTQTVRWTNHRYAVRRYRPRIEGGFACIERWTDLDDPTSMFWRTISRDNVTLWFGLTAASRIADPTDSTRIFEWLPCLTHDDRGQAMTYEYVQDPANAWEPDVPWELQRTPAARQTNRYPSRIRYGNVQPYLPEMAADKMDALPSDWMFEVVFDYGDHSGEFPTPELDSPLQKSDWLNRPDAFSTFRAGFEVRTYRLCRRVLMFHHMPDAPGVGRNCLVRSTEFDYEPAGSSSDPLAPGFARLASVTHRHYQRSDPEGDLDRSAPLPPVRLRYSTARVDPTVRYLRREQLPGLPVGTQGADFRWIDLDGEGLSGVLQRSGSAWHYRPNRGEGRFGPHRTVAPLPSLAATEAASVQLLDLDGSGTVDVVEFDGPAPGFHERDAETGWKRHVPFLSLPNIDWQHPQLRFVDLTGDGQADALITEQEVFTWYPSLGNEGFGPARRAAMAADERDGPRVVFADGSETIFLADMSGDGLTDLVRIRNGEVCWWPNLGHGRFGRRVQMGGAPHFDAPELYDPRRIRLADLDGSGPTDIIYLGRQGAQLYFNRSGNSLSSARVVSLPMATLNLDAVQVADLLGKGTACLVWNSHLPADAERPVAYIDIMGLDDSSSGVKLPGGKPHLLVHIDNSLGASTEIEYTPSTRFYLDDLTAGHAWVTRLPFPVHCVSRVTVRDAWRGTAFSQRWTYHHGCYDGVEREFRGFGRVEQVDLDEYGSSENTTSPWVTEDRRLFQPPVKTISWYHTGVAADRARLLKQFAGEYFPARHAAQLPTAADAFAERELPEPELPADLDGGEWREAVRACKGMLLRQEVYELSLEQMLADPPRDVPVRLFSVATHNVRLQRLQPRGGNRHSVWLATESEAITYHHELALADLQGQALATLTPDPRVAHTLHLRIDELGQPEQSIAVGYGRWKAVPYPGLPRPDLIEAVQSERHLAYSEIRRSVDLAHYAAAVAGVSAAECPLLHWRPRLACETSSWELGGIAPPAGRRWFVPADFSNLDLSAHFGHLPGETVPPTLVQRLAYHQPLAAGRSARLVERQRTLYCDDAANDSPPTVALPFGEHGPRGLKYEDFRLALTADLLSTVFGSSPAGEPRADKLDWPARSGGAAPGTLTVRGMLADPARSGYAPGSAVGAPSTEFWQRSGRAGFAPDAHRHFFLPERFTDAFGQVTTLEYDALDLFIQRNTDAAGNTSSLAEDDAGRPRFDYRVLAPLELVDASGNHSEVAFDIRGLVVAAALKGKLVGDMWQGDHLGDFDFAQLNPEPEDVVAWCTQRAFDHAAEQVARDWLGTATSRFVYHFGEAVDGVGKLQWGTHMPGAAGIRRETHHGKLLGGWSSRLQIALECSDGSGAVLMRKQQAEPDPATPARRRWLVEGLVRVNNKGQPVQQYEPDFTADFGCQLPPAAGVTTSMFYDAPGRQVRTEHPDGSFERVEFTPWQVEQWDANDCVLDSAWYTARKNLDTDLPLAIDARGLVDAEPERRAAWLAARHAGTPARTLLDSLGRDVITLAHNRVPDSAGGFRHGGRQWRDEFYLTYSKLDAEGKPLWIRDARGNLVMQYLSLHKPIRLVDDPSETMPTGASPAYDVAGRLLHQHSMDAGSRWMLPDAAGEPLAAWDFNERQVGAQAWEEEHRLHWTEYDALRRPVARWMRVWHRPRGSTQGWTADPPVMLERLVYQDALADDRANLNGQLVSQLDASGSLQTVRRSFGGPVEEQRRSLLRDATAAFSDWSAPVVAGDTRLEDEVYIHIAEHDALGRPTRILNWHRDVTVAADHNERATPGKSNRVGVYVPSYNERGLLRAEALHIRASKETDAQGRVTITPDAQRSSQAIRAVSYNARGQKTSLELGNGTTTRYHYDPERFRLVRLYTRRDARFTDDCAGDPDSVEPQRPCGVQNLRYWYDAVGNITHIRDDAQQTIYFKNQVAEPSNDYEYDALYRLTLASGRENDLLTGSPSIREGPWPRKPIPTDDQLRRYTQQFDYDSVGNFMRMHHEAGAGTWTRWYAMAADSNRLHRTWEGNKNWSATTATQKVSYRHDAHGSMLNLASTTAARNLRWDWRDMVRHIDLGGNAKVWYQYDASKQRTRKHITRDGHTEERCDLGGYERYRRWNAGGAVIEEIESHHLFEGEQRVLLVDDVWRAKDPPDPAGPDAVENTVWRFQYGNHLGSVGVELDELARLISHEEFHAYGTSAYRVMNDANDAPVKRFRYSGLEHDQEAGTSYHGARSFAGLLARWISPDPLDIEVDANTYDYCHCNPVAFIDEDGLAPKPKNKFKPNSVGTRRDTRAAFEATSQTIEARGRVVIGKEVHSGPKSRHDGVNARESDGGDVKTAEDTTQRVGRYRDAAGDLDESKLESRASTKLSQVEKHQRDSGISEELFVWLKGKFSKSEGAHIKSIWKAEGAKRGIPVTVGSLVKFLKSGSGPKSTLGAIVGIMAFLRGSSAEAAEVSKPTHRQASDVSLTDLVPTREQIVDEVTPDEVQLLVTGAALALQVDSFSAETARKAFDLAYARNGNLRRIGGLPMAIDSVTGELFGLETTVFGDGAGIPGQLTSLGVMRGIPGSYFLSEDNQMLFMLEEGQGWSLRAKDPESGQWEVISR